MVNLNRAPSQTIDPKTASFLTLDDISTTLRLVLTEMKNERDEGMEISLPGTATTTLSIIDLIKKDPHHAVKGYILNNDGVNKIRVTHNDASRSDIWEVLPNESIPRMFNRKVINKIFIKSIGGDSAYRLLLLW